MFRALRARNESETAWATLSLSEPSTQDIKYRNINYNHWLLQLQLLNVWENRCQVVWISEPDSICIDWLRNVSTRACLWSVCWFYHWRNCEVVGRLPQACDDVYCLVIHPPQHFQTLPILRAISDTHNTLPTIWFIFNIRNFSHIGCMNYISCTWLLRYCLSVLYLICVTFEIYPTLWDIFFISVTSEILPTVLDIFHKHDFLNTAHCLSYVLYRSHTALPQLTLLLPSGNRCYTGRLPILSF